jgi:rod shape-determining protein MreD
MIDRIVGIAENAYVRLFLIGLVFLGLQTTILNDMRPFGVSLEIMILLAASAGLARGSEVGAIAGFMIGLMYDFVLTTPLGLGAAVFAIVGYLAGFVHSFVHEPTWWSRVFLGAFASGFGMILMAGAIALVGTDGIFTTKVLTIALVVATCNAIFSLPTEKLCRWAMTKEKVIR